MHDEYEHLRESADAETERRRDVAARHGYADPYPDRLGSGWPALHDPLPGEYRPMFGYPCRECGVRVRLVIPAPGRLAWRHVAGGG